MSLPHTLLVLLTLLATSNSIARAQGSRADYDRADSFRALTSDKVFRTNIRPHWINESSNFWYRIQTGVNTSRFVLVLSAQGQRHDAFDHEQLAAALSQVAGKAVLADQLPFQQIRFSSDLKSIYFTAFGSAYRCDLNSYAITANTQTEVGETTIPKLDSLRRSRDGGVETYVRFVNRTRSMVRLIWIDRRGDRQPYESIPAGKEHRQHTYAQHVWLVTDADNRPLHIFQAVAETGVAIIDASTPLKLDNIRSETASPGLSPDGEWQALIKGHNLHLRNQNTGEEIALSSDGEQDNRYSGPFYWSPDSSKLVSFQEQPGERREVRLIESSPRDQLQPKLHSFVYAKPGDRLDVRQPRLFHVTTRKQVTIADNLFPTPWSISQVRWHRESKRFTFLYNQRGHQVLRIVAVDADTGEAAALVDETSDTFIDYSRKQFSRYLDDTDEIIWMSERDGWNHLFLYDSRTGQVKNQVTQGPWVVRGVDRVDEMNRQIWFRAGGIYPEQDPYYIHYCRVNFDGSGLTVLTAGNGTHSVEFSPDGRYLLDTYSRVDLPPVAELREASDGTLICELERGDWKMLLETGWQPPERFVAKGRDGITNIYGVIYRPTDFDPAKKYPVIEKIYAGPHSAFVPKRFASYRPEQANAELGFVVVQIDGMGTSHRSKAFHDVCWKNLGDSGFPDRILWLKAAARKDASLNLSRVGIYGGSAGGQSALRALLAFGDFYKVAAADCGCHDNRMDKVWWNEQWMGWPVGPHYAEQSNVTNAHKLEGKLLLTVGELDRNVDPASTMQVVDALIKADKDFDLLIVPGAGHGVGESRYGKRRRRDFFVRHLLGVEPRWSP